MANTEVKILINAVDNASATIKKVSGGLGDMKSMLVAGAAAVAAMTAAYMVAKKVIDETVGVMVAYAEQVRDLSRITGMNAEETSRLIQVADDLKVEYGTLTTAARMLASQGMVPTIDTLATLSDKYNSFIDKSAQAEWAVKTFGRQYVEMTKILEAGGDALKEAAANQPEGLILSQEDLDKARKYEIAVNELDDTFTALKVTIGTALVPVVTAITKETTKATTAFINFATRTVDLDKTLGHLLGIYKSLYITQQQADLVAANTVVGIQEMTLIVGGMVEQYNALEEAVYGLDGQERLYHDTLLDQIALYQEASPTYEEYVIQQEAIAEATKLATDAIDAEVAAAEAARQKIGEELVGAYANLEQAQRNWSEKVAEDAFAALEETEAGAGKVAEGVAILDDLFGTNIADREAYAKAQADIAAAFAVGTLTGEGYRAKMLELAGVFEKSMAKDIDLARTAVEKLQAALNALPTEKEIIIKISAQYPTVPYQDLLNWETPDQGGGSPGGEGNTSPTSNSPTSYSNSNLIINTYTDAAAATAVAQAIARMKAADRTAERMGG